MNETKKSEQVEYSNSINGAGINFLQSSGRTTTEIIIERKESQNSFEFGKADDRHKIYYDDLVDGRDKLGAAMALKRLRLELEAQLQAEMQNLSGANNGSDKN